MNIVKEVTAFENCKTELLIVGVRKNTNQLESWGKFSNFFGDCFEEWLKSGDIQTDRKKSPKFLLVIRKTL